MGEALHSRRVSNMIGCTDRSLIDAIKAGKFPTANLVGPEGSKLKQYFIDEEDETLQELLAIREAGDELPEWLESRDKQKRKPPAPPPLPTAFKDTPEYAKKKAKVTHEYGSKENYKTKVWQEDENGERVFVTSVPGLVEPETLQEKYPQGGAFFLVVYRRLSNGEWEYCPEVSRDDKPVLIHPKSGHDGEVSESPSPLVDPDRAEDSRLIRETARNVIEKRIHGDGEGTPALVQMQSNITELLSGLIQAQNTNYQQLMQMTAAQHQQALERMAKEAADRAEERKHEMEVLAQRHALDMDRLKAEADQRAAAIRAEAEARLKEIEAKAELEKERIRLDSEEREKRTAQFTAELQRIQAEGLVKLKELDDKKMALIQEQMKGNMDRVSETIERHEAFYQEREAHRKEIFELMSSMQPTLIWANALKDIGARVGDKIPAILGTVSQLAAASQGHPLQGAPPAAQIGTAQSQTAKEGGIIMGKGILDQIKGSPESRAMLRELLEDLAKFAEDDDPPALFGQKLLSMASTVPGFATAFVEIYKTPLPTLLKGVLDEGKAHDILVSEKGSIFWKNLVQYIKNYYAAQSSPPTA